MGIELRQNLKLTQQLVMTPQLQQAIKLLQLSRFELLRPQQEMLENPMLEEAPGTFPKRPKLRHRLTSPQDFTLDEADLTRNADWEDYLGDFFQYDQTVSVQRDGNS